MNIGRSGLRRKEIEDKCYQLARLIKPALPSGCGFALLMFDLGADGNIAYVANARREDMVKAMLKLIANVEAS